MSLTTLVEIRRESPVAATLRLDLGGAPLEYRPGQYVTIDPHQFEALGPALRERAAKRGRPEGAGYFSLSSDATDPGAVELTVKAGPSTAAPLPHFLLRDARPGLTIAITGPAGRYFLPADPPAGIQGFLHLCAGSGVAPNRGMVRHALARGWTQRHVLLLQERTPEDVLFRSEWGELLRTHDDRFRMRTVFSSSSQYVTPEIVRQAMAGFIEADSSLAFLCGPNAARNGRPGFLDHWKSALREAIGFPPSNVITEG
jgi:3-ketosteroid 9alpha-monooxygenase subunit B